MIRYVMEATYPGSFHKKEAACLGKHIKNRHNVVLVGMRRVGISNFLRFFLYHKEIVKAHVDKNENHIFIPVDLNDLIELEISPFWTLTLKRIADAIENSKTLPSTVKKKAENLFLDSIQTQDLFFTIDKVRSCIKLIIENGLTPTIFFIRFDRLANAITPEFYSNLIGLREGFHQELSYVFTSFRTLDEIAPAIFTKSSLVDFSRNMYLGPVSKEDIRIIYNSQSKKYNLSLSKSLEAALFKIVNGYVRYLNLSLIYLSEQKNSMENLKGDFLDQLSSDERIFYQSEELWESLNISEQEIIKKVILQEKIDKKELEGNSYLLETGMVTKINESFKLFSPLFSRYVENLLEKNETKEISANFDFTKKENLLFNLLLKNLSEIVEREDIIENVWPEVEALGVSDWAIDRLVARLRAKMKLQNSKYEIQTIKTRGYKLINIV